MPEAIKCKCYDNLDTSACLLCNIYLCSECKNKYCAQTDDVFRCDICLSVIEDPEFKIHFNYNYEFISPKNQKRFCVFNVFDTSYHLLEVALEVIETFEYTDNFKDFLLNYLEQAVKENTLTDQTPIPWMQYELSYQYKSQCGCHCFKLETACDD